MECGVPEAMLMDHGTPWLECESPHGRGPWLTVWLMQQGIQLHWSGYRHPQPRAKSGTLSRFAAARAN